MSIKSNIEEIHSKVIEACRQVGRRQEEVTLIAVTKTKPIEAMEQALSCGIIHVGENKVQEIINKYPHFENNFKWHMIGHLQTNKIKSIIDKVELIHSVDRMKLAQLISLEASKINKVQNILIQVNIAEEETKFGIEKNEVEAFIKEAAQLPNICIKGLMTVAPFVEDAEENRPIFREMFQVFVDINSKNIDNVTMDVLSMGMTNDFEVAIEEGATMVRIGTAIFGERN
ncbi:MAG: YggS family pyridoxal phosphate-dependent enzyme [Firmicutes bacterium HGW-Firmicutes-7]|nr:MAG: YggS family pyridoxal phosphate-dependent enzyme [Firmicutes bacterium HGW-Firmicutes-7]